jgi:iron complex transport system substrate-binding protein
MRPSRLLALVAALTALVLPLTACGSQEQDGTSTSSDGAASSAFPVTIKHAYGETTIERKPTRVATIAWANHEVPLALGVVPVGMSRATWGDDNGNGVLPWVEDRLHELGAKTPVLFDETDGIDYEAVADTRPDVILAAYSGITKKEYDTLSKIAPVIAYPDVAWGASYQQMITMESKALGLEQQGQQLIAKLDDEVAASYAAHPSLAGKTVMFGYIDPNDFSKVGFYTTHDTRPGFMKSVGMTMPKVVEEASAKTDEFYVTRSAEHPEAFDDVDVLVLYGDADGSLVKRIQADPLLSKIPAVKRGSIAVLEDSTPLAASANPSPLSIGWGVDRYFDLLAAAADKA